MISRNLLYEWEKGTKKNNLQNNLQNKLFVGKCGSGAEGNAFAQTTEPKEKNAKAKTRKKRHLGNPPNREELRLETFLTTTEGIGRFFSLISVSPMDDLA
jgi:hypothetical protein